MGLVKNIEVLKENINQQNLNIDAHFREQASELARMQKFIDGVIKHEVANATKQIEASASLQKYFITGELPNVNTERHSWPVSPDFSIYLVELIELNDYDLIIEFGSGLSTVIIAKALRNIASRRSEKKTVTFASFDHLDHYYQQTLAYLEHSGLAEDVQLTLAPLKDWLSPDGKTQPYYECEAMLVSLAKKHKHANQRLLVIVDGPPAATGKHARYPAGPLILQHFGGVHIDLLLDDYIRDDEKEIAKRWQADISAMQLHCIVTERRLEKDACLIRINPLNRKS